MAIFKHFQGKNKQDVPQNVFYPNFRPKKEIVTFPSFFVINNNCCAASVASEQQHKQDLRKIYRRGDEFSN